MARHLIMFLKLSSAVAVLTFISSGVTNGAITIEDGREMGISIISNGLRKAEIPDFRGTTNLDNIGTLVTDIRNLAVNNIRLTNSTSLALGDDNTINVVTSDLSVDMRADWEAELQSDSKTFKDEGAIAYRLNPVSINADYTYETRDGLPQMFRQVSCQATVVFSTPLISALNGDSSSWLYLILMNHLEEDLKEDVRNEICKMFDPLINSAVHRRFSSYGDKLLPKCPEIPNAILTGCSMSPGDLCSYNCTRGYAPDPHLSSIRCLENILWNVDIESLCQAPPIIDPPLEDETTRTEETVRMFCKIDDEGATYYWFKGDKQLSDGDIEGGIIVLSSHLIIPDVKMSDSGNYTCVARNSRGQEVQSSLQLTVTSEELRIIEGPVDTDLVLGESFIFPCRANDPSAVITWFKDDLLIEDEIVHNVFVTDDNSLLIRDAGFEHPGTYKCVAENQENVIAEAYATFAFPTGNIFDTQPSDALVLVDEDYVLRCSLQNPTLTVQWYKDGSSLEFNNRILKMRGRVFFRSIVETDEGFYKCIASDIRGNQGPSVSAQVTVVPHGLNRPECGNVTSSEVRTSNDEANRRRIVGGQDAVRGSAPWMARLFVRGRGHVCGGSLIDRRWVVTAAHCFHLKNPPSKEDLSIRLGDHSVLDTEQSETLIQVEEIYEHEDFNSNTFDNDIALIKLLNPVRAYTDYIRPICLADRITDRALMTPGALGRVNGWGRVAEGGITPDYLTEVYIPFVTFTTCKRHFRESEIHFTKNMFCAGYSRGGADACQGDSGGPYSITDNTGKWYLTGLVSWGEGCGRRDQYGSYTRYSKYHRWIQTTINRDLRS